MAASSGRWRRSAGSASASGAPRASRAAMARPIRGPRACSPASAAAWPRCRGRSRRGCVVRCAPAGPSPAWRDRTTAGGSRRGRSSRGPVRGGRRCLAAHAAANHQGDPQVRSLLAGIRYNPLTVIAVAFARTQVRHPLDGFGMLTPSGEGRPLLGVLWDSSTWQHRAPADRHLLRCMSGDPAMAGTRRRRGGAPHHRGTRPALRRHRPAAARLGLPPPAGHRRVRGRPPGAAGRARPRARRHAGDVPRRQQLPRHRRERVPEGSRDRGRGSRVPGPSATDDRRGPSLGRVPRPLDGGAGCRRRRPPCSPPRRRTPVRVRMPRPGGDSSRRPAIRRSSARCPT
jgi:hypothetical protein